MPVTRKFYNNRDYTIDHVNQVVKLSPEFFTKLKEKQFWNNSGFKKVTGSRMSGIVGEGPFDSEFDVFCQIARIGLPVLDRKYVDAGIAIEPLVIDVLEKQLGEEILTYPGPKYKFDYFADKDPVVGGLPDGFVQSKNLVIEVKTVGEKKWDYWNKYGTPKSYQYQAQLYAYLMGVEDYTIVATFLREEDYKNPENFPIADRRVKNWNYKVNKELVEMQIKRIKEWYSQYTESGISPKYNEMKDKDLLTWLECSNESEWSELKNKWIQEGKLTDA